ncbi:MAG: immunoglobulin domain-containing protein [Verrucomicrobiales bacterium]|nr:immunoglobulin domain-containing protein [Verrucomicrobiales bacterium]
MYSKQRTQRAARMAGLAIAGLLGGWSGHAADADVKGQWDFTNGNLNGTIGNPLVYLTWGTPNTATATTFGTTTSLGLPAIGGTEARVMGFPAGDLDGTGYAMPIDSPANGGGTLVNQWTIIYDILFPAASDAQWRSFIDTDQMLVQADGEFFVNPSNGIGISGQYEGTINPDTWYRVAFVVDQGPANEIRKYINGVLVGTQGAGGADGRWAVFGDAWLFHDNDGDTAPGYVSSIQFRNRALTTPQVGALGSPTANGVPTSIPTIPATVLSTTPASGDQNASPKPTLSAVLDQGQTTVDAGSIKLYLDGSVVAATVTPSGGIYTISYAIPTLLAPDSEHSAALDFSDSLHGAQTYTWTFKVGTYKEIVLPEPIVLETFDQVAEGGLPSGWTVSNQTDSLTGAPDFDDPNSDTYMDWTVISRERLLNVFGQRRLNFNPVVVNGVPLESLVSGNFIYAESDNRGGNQIQYVTTGDYNLSGKSDIYLSFWSTYEQNQDSLGAVEYSVDGGNTWLPALYMVEQPDYITDAEGNVDALATLGTARGDQALQLAYGDLISAPVTQDLAPFISARVNDDQFESKRVEVLRLAQADNQSRVRIRFTQTGTGSWYFGVDNLGLYSVSQLAPEITTQPLSQLVSAGNPLVLEVVVTGTAPLTYQWKFNDEDLPGETGPTLTIASAQASNAGRYSVSISNAVGTALSAVATVDVFGGAITENLVVHLKLDGAYADSSGRNNNGTAVGAPTFVTGQVGSQAVHFGAASDYITLGVPTDLNFGTATDFSLAFWAKAVAWSSDPSLIGNKDWNSGGNQGYVLATDGDGHFQWNLSGAPGSRKDYDGPAGTFSDGEWHHIAVTYDRSGSATTYVDGQAVDTRPLTASENDVSTPNGLATNIAQDGTGTYGASFTDLAMDDIGIWRRVLSPQEIGGIHTAGLQGQDLSTVSVVQEQIEFTSITLDGNKVTVSWIGAGTLQSAPGVNGPWTDVAGATSPYQTTATGGALFFRVAN